MQSIKLTELAKTISIEAERAECNSSVVFLEFSKIIPDVHFHAICVSQVSFTRLGQY